MYPYMYSICDVESARRDFRDFQKISKVEVVWNHGRECCGRDSLIPITMFLRRFYWIYVAIVSFYSLFATHFHSLPSQLSSVYIYPYGRSFFHDRTTYIFPFYFSLDFYTSSWRDAWPQVAYCSICCLLYRWLYHMGAGRSSDQQCQGRNE